MSTKKAPTTKSPPKRLKPGELNEVVLRYMREHEKEQPFTASAVAKATGRSSGAVANCLARLAKGNLVRQAKKSPRAYALPKKSK